MCREETNAWQRILLRRILLDAKPVVWTVAEVESTHSPQHPRHTRSRQATKVHFIQHPAPGTKIQNRTLLLESSLLSRLQWWLATFGLWSLVHPDMEVDSYAYENDSQPQETILSGHTRAIQPGRQAQQRQSIVRGEEIGRLGAREF